ncbi:tyrosine-protein phosphatase [Oxalobacteraceae bacterium CAVE-383]|nr:tyrosine-protein phosphatase [Oxalobacteraceae bacterium CAVE-383]
MPFGKRHITLGGVCNLRDLGGYPVADGGSTRWGQVLRSDSPHALQSNDMSALVEAGLTKVVDLRDASEIARHPNPFRIHGSVHYNHVPLFAHLDLRAHLARAAKVDDVLLELYCEVLTERQQALYAALSAIADAEPGAVLFHCTVGKDRTGVLAALLLAAVGASKDDIIADYALTSGRIDGIRQSMLAKFAAGRIDGCKGADRQSFISLFSSEPSTMRGMLDYLDGRYGGIDAYLHVLDPGQTLRKKLRARMLC